MCMDSKLILCARCLRVSVSVTRAVCCIIDERSNDEGEENETAIERIIYF